MPDTTPTEARIDSLTVAISDAEDEPGESGDGATIREVAASLLADGWTSPEDVAALRAERDAAYRGRAELLAVLANVFPAQMHEADPATPGWPVLFLDTPEGQVSWHINPDDLDLFDTDKYALANDEDPAGRVVWDGHTNEEKSRRLHRLATCYQPIDYLAEMPLGSDTAPLTDAQVQRVACLAHGMLAARIAVELLKDRARIAELETLSEQAWGDGVAGRHLLEERADRFRTRVAELEAQADRVRQVHQPIEAVNMRHNPRGQLAYVCSGCGTDDGNWQVYPCPTIRALDLPGDIPARPRTPKETR